MWQSVSTAYRAIERTSQYFESTPEDHRLSEQLALLPVLHDWAPVTATEAEEVTYVLGVYADPGDEPTRREAASVASTLIRTMAVDRARSGAPEPAAPAVGDGEQIGGAEDPRQPDMLAGPVRPPDADQPIGTAGSPVGPSGVIGGSVNPGKQGQARKQRTRTAVVRRVLTVILGLVLIAAAILILVRFYAKG